MKVQIFTLLLFICGLSTQLNAQKGLDGVWEGTITIGGIYSTQALPIQLYLTVEGNRVEGRSYVKTGENTTVQMHLSGRVFRDNSIQLSEVEFIGDEENDQFPKFNRQYQLIWKRDLWEAGLNGYWQEVTNITFAKFRQRGRLKLTKQKPKGV